MFSVLTLNLRFGLADDGANNWRYRKKGFQPFLEIEGTKESIQQLASQIGLLWEKRIILNYLTIFDIIKRQLNLSFYDVTFGNFTNIRFDMTQYLNLIEADAVY